VAQEMLGQRQIAALLVDVGRVGVPEHMWVKSTAEDGFDDSLDQVPDVLRGWPLN
jgi:hypothetical protein